MWLPNMPIRCIIIASATAPALGVRDMLFFLCLWCFYRLYLSLLWDLGDITKDQTLGKSSQGATQFSTNCFLRQFPRQNWFTHWQKIRIYYFSTRLSSRQKDRCRAALSQERQPSLNQTRTRFSGRLLFLTPGRLKPFGDHFKSRRIF